MSRILITPRSLSSGSHPALAALEEAGFELVMPAPGETPSEAALLAAVPGCVGWLAGVEPVSEAVIEAALGPNPTVSRTPSPWELDSKDDTQERFTTEHRAR